MQCCDPYLVTYISAIITMIEAAIFACLNMVIILISTCTIPPPDGDKGIITNFLAPIWKTYLLANGTCKADNIPDGWVFPDSNATDPLLTPHKNYEYQIAYLVLHFLWIIASIVLIFGNARKRWGYYIPWMLMTTTLIIMDTVIGSMYLSNLTGIPAAEIFNPDFWMGMYYMRFQAIWFMNIIQLFNVLHAFCVCYRKRTKQARRDKKIEEKVRAEVAAEQNSSQEQQQPDLQQQQQQQQMMKKPDAADLGGAISRAPAPRTLKDERNQQAMEMVTRAPPRYAQPPQPDVVHRNPSNAPKESRPYSYLNPGFRPSDSHDVDGMKRHGVPSHPGVTNKAYVRDEDRMPRPQSRRRSLEDFPDENGYISDSPLNRGNRQFRAPQGGQGGAAAGPGVRRNQSVRPAPGGYHSDADNQRPARHSQRPPALPRVTPGGPPPSRGQDPRYRDPVNNRHNRQPYEH